MQCSSEYFANAIICSSKSLIHFLCLGEEGQDFFNPYKRKKTMSTTHRIVDVDCIVSLGHPSSV